MVKTTSQDITREIREIFQTLGATASLDQSNGIVVNAPALGEPITSVAQDTAATVGAKAENAAQAQKKWAEVPRETREAFLQVLAATIKENQEAFARLITLEGGKPKKDAVAEADRASGVFTMTLSDDAKAGKKVAKPAGTIGLITSYNFPLAVANWTIAPGLLAGDSVVWKPSETTPLSAIAYKAVFDKAVQRFNQSKGTEIVPADLVQVVIGGRDLGKDLVKNEGINMVSATGSVGMGRGIKQTLAEKQNNKVPPILELGGNNAVVISDKLADEDLRKAAKALMDSTVFGGGQLCTCTRRVIVHENVYKKFMLAYQAEVEAFVGDGIKNPLTVEPEKDVYSYAPLIHKAAYDSFDRALNLAQQEGGRLISGGKRLMQDKHPNAYYVTPALVEMPGLTKSMHEETFGPLVYITRYSGELENAMQQVNGPDNAGLINGIYTASQAEAKKFAEMDQAGWSTVNSPIGTRGPMRWSDNFGGNKASGEGRILDHKNPLGAFTLPDAQAEVRSQPTPHVTIHETTIPMNWDTRAIEVGGKVANEGRQ